MNLLASLFALPDPLHPAVVHFPIVLLLLAVPVAVAAVFRRPRCLPVVAAVLLGLGAVGAVVAVQTGEDESERVAETPALEAVLEEHEEWAERTQVVALVAAVLALGAVALGRGPGIALGARVLAAAVALAAGWCVAETGHYGGVLVYQHGAGVNSAPGGVAGAVVRPGVDAD
jgi:uncharacterized membrane protein